MSKMIQNISLLIFSSMIFIWGYLIPSYLEEFGRDSWIYVLLTLALALVLILFSKKINNKFFDVLEAIYLFFSVVFILYTACNAISNFLLLEKGFIGSLVPLIVAVFLLEFGDSDTIISTSTIFFLFGLIVLIIPFFLGQGNKKYELCLPIQMEGNLIKIMIGLFIPLDLMFLYRLDFTKKEILFSNVFIFILSALYLITLVSIFSEPYLSKMGFPGFMLYENKGEAALFRQIDFLLLYLIPISVIFTSSLRINIVRKTFKIKKNIVSSFIMGIIVLVLTIMINIFMFDMFYFLLALLGILFLWRIYGLFKRNKEAF